MSCHQAVPHSEDQLLIRLRARALFIFPKDRTDCVNHFLTWKTARTSHRNLALQSRIRITQMNEVTHRGNSSMLVYVFVRFSLYFWSSLRYERVSKEYTQNRKERKKKRTHTRDCSCNACTMRQGRVRSVYLSDMMSSCLSMEGRLSYNTIYRFRGDVAMSYLYQNTRVWI